MKVLTFSCFNFYYTFGIGRPPNRYSWRPCQDDLRGGSLILVLNVEAGSQSSVRSSPGTNSRENTIAHGRKMATSPDRDQLEWMKAELAAALADRDKKARQVAELTAEVEAMQAELARVTSVSREQIDGLAKELDNERVKSEHA